MKVFDINKQTLLKAALLLVLGANFFAGFHLGERTHETNLSQTDPRSEVATPADDPPPTPTAAAPAAPAPAAPAAPTELARTSDLATPVPAAAAEPACSSGAAIASTVNACNTVYNVRLFYGTFRSEQNGTAPGPVHGCGEARRLGADANSEPLRLPWGFLDPRNPDAKTVMLDEMTRVIRGSACGNQTPTQVAQERVNSCEVDSSGRELDSAKRGDCLLARLTALRRGTLRGAALFEEMQQIVEQLKSVLQDWAEADCSRSADTSCGSGAERFKSRITSAIEGLRYRLGEANSRTGRSSSAFDRQVDRLIASIDSIVPNTRGRHVTEVARREANDNRQEARELQKEMREIENDMRRNGCMGGATALGGIRNNAGICREMASQLQDLQGDRRDLFADTHAADAYADLLDIDGMSPAVRSRLLRDARGPYMATLNQLANLDPLHTDPVLDYQMRDAIQRINLGYGAGGDGLTGNQLGLNGAVDPRTGLPLRPGIPFQQGIPLNQALLGGRGGIQTGIPLNLAGGGAGAGGVVFAQPGYAAGANRTAAFGSSAMVGGQQPVFGAQRAGARPNLSALPDQTFAQRSAVTSARSGVRMAPGMNAGYTVPAAGAAVSARP